MRRITLTLLFFAITSMAATKVLAQGCPAAPSSIGNSFEAFRSWCLYTAKGQVRDIGGGRYQCYCAPGSSAAANSATGVPLLDVLLWLFGPDPNAAARKAEREALMRQLEAERQAAIARKESEEAARLDAILLRVQSSLKGLNNF